MRYTRALDERPHQPLRGCQLKTLATDLSDHHAASIYEIWRKRPIRTLGIQLNVRTVSEDNKDETMSFILLDLNT